MTNMTIGENIKNLRKHYRMPQEQLAEMLNMTVSAVSQWECGKTMPDISVLPALANLFQTSIDELLGVDRSKNEAKIKEVLTEASRLYGEGIEVKGNEHSCLQAAVQFLKQSLALYPNSAPLMADLAKYLLELGSLDESRTYCERILSAPFSDAESRTKATVTMIGICVQEDDDETALALAQQQPDVWSSKQDQLMWLLKGDELTKLCRRYSLFCLNRLAFCFENIADTASTEDQICLLQKIPALYNLYFENGDYGYQSQYIEAAYTELAGIYLSVHDTEKALSALADAAEYAVRFDTYDVQLRYSSVAPNGEEDGGWINSDGNRSSQMLEKLTDNEIYDAVRNTETFRSILQMLEKYADVK